MSPLTREASSEARQCGEPSIVPCPIVKSATSTSADRMTSAGADARFAPVTPAVAVSHFGVAGRPARVGTERHVACSLSGTLTNGTLTNGPWARRLA
jgi:hypothetical protein